MSSTFTEEGGAIDSESCHGLKCGWGGKYLNFWLAYPYCAKVNFCFSQSAVFLIDHTSSWSSALLPAPRPPPLESWGSPGHLLSLGLLLD